MLIYRASMDTNSGLELLHKRLREIRLAQGLTLQDVAEKSKGEITAIALGSYERGDRAINAGRLIAIAGIYSVPVSEFFNQNYKSLTQGRITFDLRRLLLAHDPTAIAFSNSLTRVAQMRRDWNGEVISLRSSDITSLSLFSGLTNSEIVSIIDRFTFAKQ